MSCGYTAVELAEWCGGVWDSGPPAQVRGVIHNTRDLRAGEVFVALRGARCDGHAFLDDALRQGAAGAVVRRDAERAGEAGFPLLRVDDPEAALRAMAAGYRHKAAPHIVGVTGSAGKSTVKEMTAQILSTAAPTACTRGNWNNQIGLPLSLLAMPAGTRYGVFEIGMNHPGEIADLCRLLNPAWGVVTNIGPVHLEFFKSVEDIAREKAAMLGALGESGVAFLNRDAAFFDLLRAAARCRVVTVSLRDDADFVGVERSAAESQMTVRETASGQTHRLRLPCASEYNAANALLAAAVARRLGCEWDRIAEALEQYRAPPMRWERFEAGGVCVINDAYNANPMSMRAALRNFAELEVEGARWLVLGGMKELGAAEREEHRGLGTVVAEGPWRGVVCVGEMGGWIADAIADAGWRDERLIRCDSNEAAAQALKGRLRGGDAVLLKASRAVRLEEVAAVMKQVLEGRS
jgi:UDP-N-acetylmuramoyl-tripeptide--D-alanyl-D-alanine ligase